MLLIHASEVKKQFNHELLLDIEDFKLYEGDKIGLVGLNGTGKTTFLNILSGLVESDSGQIIEKATISYFEQFGKREQANLKTLKELNVVQQNMQDTVSGGEDTRLRLAATLSKAHHVIFMDEPTSNLDVEGVAILSEKIKLMTTFILISHDRTLLDEVCTKIVEIRDTKLYEHHGNYSAFLEQREIEMQTQQGEYENYRNEKSRLEKLYIQKQESAKAVTARPKSISKHEYRILNFGRSRPSDVQQKNMHRSAKAVATRLEHLEVKEQPKIKEKIKIDFNLSDPPKNRTIVEGWDIHFSYGEKIIFQDASFVIERKDRVAIMGGNGVGKSTLISLVLNQWKGIKVAPKAKIGYLSQTSENLQFDSTVIENALEGSIQDTTTVRTVLSRLLFKADDLSKKASVLSGGERVKLQFAKLLVSDINVLILDEPTNYLDIPSIEQVQEILSQYEGTLIFVSHDRMFADAIATKLLFIEQQKIRIFEGNISSYDLAKQQKAIKPKEQSIIKRLESELNEVILKMSNPKEDKTELEIKYQELLEELRRERNKTDAD